MSGTMDPVPEPRIVSSIREIADKIRHAQSNDGAPGRTILLIGAGCSVSARIPGAAQIARDMTMQIAKILAGEHADPPTAYQWLVKTQRLDPCHDGKKPANDAAIDWYRVYDDMFRRHYASPDEVRALFDGILTGVGDTINWAHLCIGELVAKRFVSTVLTTNFDQLVLSGMARAGVLPAVCDGIESLNRISGAPRHSQLVELHGSRHTYILRNTPHDVAAVGTDSQAQAAINKLLQGATVFLAIGYGGREDGVMDLLIRAAESYPGKNLFWISHSADPSTIGPKVKCLLRTSRNSGLLPGQDADLFFLKLMQEMEIGSPAALATPLYTVTQLMKAVEQSDIKHEDIRAEVRTAQERLHRLQQVNLEGTGIDATISAIRKARLAGNLSESYRLALEALSYGE